ncbi:MAG: AAA family ATPase [Elusimicrobia bacterium]|nr:AAA family ATPase [Elusimicrobiota bacterium]
MKKNIFLTGAPSSGKTTLIKKIINGLGLPCGGFYTEEERIGDRRAGFMMKTIDGRTAYLAHRDIVSGCRIRRYGVSIENIENIAVDSISPSGNKIIVLDEIGKMECFSERFRKAAVDALDSPNIVIGTITLGGGGFIENIKKRDDMEIIEVLPANRDGLETKVIEKIRKLHEAAVYGKTGGKRNEQ